MKQKLAVRRMRKHPNLEQLKRQAKELLAGFQAAFPSTVDEVNALYDNPQKTTFALHDAQLVIARSYGFDSWPNPLGHRLEPGKRQKTEVPPVSS
jgi:hypothetical protein